MIPAALGGYSGEVGAGQLRFFIVRTHKRRTLQLSVGVKGVEVRAPSWVSDQEIDDFVRDKESWIKKQGVCVNAFKLAPDVFLQGGPLYVLGKVFNLEVVPVFEGPALLEELPCGWKVSADRQTAYRLIVKWYRLRAEKVFKALLEQWAGRMNIPVPICLVKEQARLWGSYSARTKTVSLNWKMVSFPIEIIEYVVIHELCHVKHLHHRPSFWDEVAIYCPSFSVHRQWLRAKARGYLF